MGSLFESGGLLFLLYCLLASAVFLCIEVTPGSADLGSVISTTGGDVSGTERRPAGLTSANLPGDSGALPTSAGPSPWKLTDWRRRLVGDGQHRSLHTELTLFGPAEMSISLAGKPVVPPTEVIGDVDVESPAPLCNGTVLLIYPRLENLPPGDESACQVAEGGEGNAECGKTEETSPVRLRTAMAVPLHSRYPETMRQNVRGAGSWWGGEYDLVSIPPPSVLIKCQPLGGCGQGDCPLEAQEWREVGWSLSEGQEVGVGHSILWRAPAGNPAHSTIVAVSTGLASLIGASILVFQAISKNTL